MCAILVEYVLQPNELIWADVDSHAVGFAEILIPLSQSQDISVEQKKMMLGKFLEVCVRVLCGLICETDCIIARTRCATRRSLCT